MESPNQQRPQDKQYPIVDVKKNKITFNLEEFLKKFALNDALLYNFPLHIRIIDEYLYNEDFESAYLYFYALLTKLPISCNVSELENSDPNLKKSAACQIYERTHELSKKKYYLYQLKRNNASKKSQGNYNKLKFQFYNQIHANLTQLLNLAKLKHTEKQDSQESKEDVIELIDKTMELSSKHGINVNDNLGDLLIKSRIEKAAMGMTTETEDHAKLNKIRTTAAKKKMAKNKIISKIRKEIRENGELSEEKLNDLNEKLNKIEEEFD